MKISVIIPVYNAERYLPVCLESLAIQTLTDFEFIVVDDCSTDSSVAVAESYLERFGGRLKIIELDANTGSGAVPRNVGLEHARGEYVFFVDADDLLIDIALEMLADFADRYRADVVYMERFFTCDEEPAPKAISAVTWSDLISVVEEPTLKADDTAERVKNFLAVQYAWAPWAKFLRRDLLVDNAITFPRMTIAEDVVWTFEVVCAAKKILHVSEPLYIYRTNEQSMMRRDRSPEQMTIFRASPLITGVDILDEFMRGHEFFRRNPDVRFKVLNFFALMQLDNITEIPTEFDPTATYETFLREFAAADSTQPALIAYLLTMNKLYRNELIT